jgi:hypothetical protein
MAHNLLIDRYVTAVSQRLTWHPKKDDLVAEVEDHLYSTVADLRGRGLTATAAVQVTLQRFGDPEVVALAFAKSPSGAMAVPTAETRRAGSLAVVCAVLFPSVLVAWWIGGALEPWGRVDRNVTAVFWVFGWVAVLTQGVLLVALTLRLSTRHGGLGRAGRAALSLIASAAVAMVSAWVFMVWAGLLAAGLALLGITLVRRRLIPRPAAIALGSSFLFGGLVWAALRLADASLLQWGGLYGDHWIANMTGLTVGVAILSVGVIGIGRWLRNEEVFEMSGTEKVLTT